MATEKQKRAAEKLVENGGNVSRAMRDAGYSPATAKNPDKLTDSKGFQELCDELGLTDRLIVQSLVEDITKNVGKRVPELTLAAKMKGLMVEKLDLSNKDGSLRPMVMDSTVAARFGDAPSEPAENSQE